MADYKDTLNLPQTEFPMKANLAQREPEMLKHWETIKIYQQIRAARTGKNKFILHDGPPYANGNIHLGHAVNKILKDIIIKAKTLDDLDAPYVPGWDCHGLPIELNIEKKFGKSGEKLSHVEFRQKCREYALEQIDIQRNEFKRLGVLGDWENPYMTMDTQYEANIVRALIQIQEKGYLVNGQKPVYWCVDCRSALAEAEVEYANRVSPAIDVKFKVINEIDFFAKFFRLGTEDNLGEGPISIPIWTTTPWTLPANAAVTIQKPTNDLLNSNYALIQIETDKGKERLFLAKNLINACLNRYNIPPDKMTYISDDFSFLSENIVPFLIRLQHPIYNDIEVPLLYGDHVDLESGTGAVHTAPAHGLDDYLVYKHYNLPDNFPNPVDEKGCFKKDVELFAGEFVLKKGNERVIEELRNNGNLLSESKIEHSYPHCWRHKSPLIYRATSQWFISMDDNNNSPLRDLAIRAVDDCEWFPSWGKQRILTMLQGRPDWCISRQRNWSTPMMLIEGRRHRIYENMSKLYEEKIAPLVEKEGIEAWHELLKDEDTLLKKLFGDQASNYQCVKDTLDVWFDSGISHFAVLNQNPVFKTENNSNIPIQADLYLEGSDQHRGWFQSSLLTSVAMYGQAPYKQVLTHGFTVDEQGRKMSKSLGNVVAPDKVMSTLGADILRLWVSSVDYRNEITCSDNILTHVTEVYRRVRNTARFLLANLHDFDPAVDILRPDQLLSLDKWVINLANEIQNSVKEYYDKYTFHIIYQKIFDFCSQELGGFYLDVIKDRQYTMQKNSRGRRSAQTAIYHILQALVRWIAPILSFTAEEIWQYIPGNKNAKSVLLTNWYELPSNKEADHFSWHEVIELRYEVNKKIEEKRNEGAIGSALEAAVEIICNGDTYNNLKKLGEELRFALITSEVVVKEGQSLQITVNHITHAKCVRCWHRRADVGVDKNHPEICGRCVKNLPEGEGEQRIYA